MSFLVVANFKSHKTQEEVLSWLNNVHPSPNIIVAPSCLHLPLFSLHNSVFKLAAQDVSPFPAGSYTGAINAGQLKDQGVTYCLVGHSERRHYFHETSIDIASKVRELVEQNIIPIICLAKEDLESQRAALEDSITHDAYFCYEPPADIGGTVTASVEDIQSTTGQIKQIFSTERVMYGGSVNEDNITSLLDLHLSGVLVASASLSPAQFNQIIVKIPHAEKI